MLIRNNSLNRDNLQVIWARITHWFRGNSQSQTSTGFEWGVVAFAAGIGLYFGAPFEPSFAIVASICAALLLFILTISEQQRRVKVLLMAMLLVHLGIGRSVWHSQAAEQPRLSSYERSYWVTGWVSAIEKSGPRLRWRIEVASIDGLDAMQTPKTIRTSTGGEGVQAGDFIRIRSVLSAPRGPAVPGGYDPARRAFFEGIGGTGYAISKAEKIADLPLTFSAKLKRNIVKLRYGLAERVLAAAPKKTAGLQVGLLTGIRTYISESQTVVLRTAGLAHILAISGLHMGLMAGSVYYLASLGLACIAPLSRRYDVRKPAAMIGAFAAAAYLLMSGASVATQRAFIMACIVFLAVILDRRAFSMRSVALAAMITLLWHPEAIVSAGFQMSFAAVAALVAVYRAWDARRVYVHHGPVGRAGQSLSSLTVTSFVAGTATSGFAMLHFNRVASYSLAGNLLAMPVFTFWVMPAALAVFPALLIGREDMPLFIMGKGLDVMLYLSAWVASWPESILYIPAGPSWIIGVFGLSFAALCLGPKLARVLGAILLPICLILWVTSKQPDLRISADGAVAFWSDEKRETLYVNRKRSDRYGREQFARRSGQGAFSQETYQKKRASCDPMACRLSIKGYTVSVTSHPSEVVQECLTADLVVLTSRSAGPVARRYCEAMLIDTRTLNHQGGQNIYLDSADIRRESASSKTRSARPWGR